MSTYLSICEWTYPHGRRCNGGVAVGEYSGQRLCDFHLRVAKCRDTTGHRMDWRECGYGFGGLLDLYCVDCQELVRSVPLDDVPAGVLDWVDEVRR